MKSLVMVLVLTLAALTSQFAEAGLLIVGSGSSATYDPLTGNYTGPPGTSNLGDLSVDGDVDLPLVPTIFDDDPAPGDIWFSAPFGGSQTLTQIATGDNLVGDFSGVVQWELISGDPLDSNFNPLPGSSSRGEWSAQFVVDPNLSTGQFAGATGTLQITAINPPFDWTVTPYSFDWTVEGRIQTVPEPSSTAVFGIVALGALVSRRRHRRN